MARFQVDINHDNPSEENFASYKEVFFQANGGDDISGNSVVTINYDDGSVSSRQLPNYEMHVQMGPRVYSDMQTVSGTPPFFVPEPSSAVLLAIGLALPPRRRTR